MGSIRAEWLRHGCLNVGALPRNRRPAISVSDSLSRIYGGVRFRVRGWPQRGFKHTLWWSEKNAPNRYGAAYMLKLDHAEGPALHIGINVEKGFEDRDVAVRRAKELNEPVDQLLLTRSWDWHRALRLLPKVGRAIQGAAGVLGGSLYCRVEFYGADDHQYFLVTPDALYLRGGFKPIAWDSIVQFACKPRRRSWGRLAIMRAFSIDECTPELHESSVLEVLRTLRNARDAWRGIRSTETRR
jgi:hypothetical protein